MTKFSKPTMPPMGIHRGVSFSEYCAWEYLNWHKLEPFRETPLHGRHKLLQPDDATESKVTGGAFHTAVLEPALFPKTYATMPVFEGHPNSNAYKAEKAKWMEEHKKFVAIKGDEFDNLVAMQEAARAHPLASAMLYGEGKNELSMAWSDEQTGIVFKGRVDRLTRVKLGTLNPAAAKPESNAVCMIDVKTTRFADPRMFERDAAKFGYHGQLALYADGLAKLQPGIVFSVFIVAIENKPPHDVVVYQVGDEELEQGRLLYRRLRDTYVECSSKQRWPGHGSRLLPLTLPKWVHEITDED